MDALLDTGISFSPYAATSPLPRLSRTSWLWSMPLAPWLAMGDSLAENVVTELRTRQLPLSHPLPAIRQLASAGNAACHDFLADMEAVPDWVDFALMQRGAAMAYRHFPQLMIALMHGGLMTTFASADSARILAGTQRLEQNVVRRLFESSTLFFGVLDTEALRPNGVAWEICLRVRLMHAMVRLRLLGSGNWDDPYSQPINQLHTAAGPLFFGSMVLDSLRSLGAAIRPDEHAGFYMIWRYVTRLLGVPLGLLGSTVEEQQAIDARILPLCFSPDDNSRRLADTLLTGLKKLPDAERVPRVVHEVLVRRILGDEKADGLGVPCHPMGIRIAGLFTLSLRLYSRIARLPMLAPHIEAFGQHYLNNTVQRGLAGVAADFQPH